MTRLGSFKCNGQRNGPWLRWFWLRMGSCTWCVVVSALRWGIKHTQWSNPASHTFQVTHLESSWEEDKTQEEQVALCRQALRHRAAGTQQQQHCWIQKKSVQLSTLFQVLSGVRPMAEFSSRLALHELLVVPDLRRMHWTDGAGWLLV